MNPRHYVDLKDASRDLQPTYYFMINCLLYSRMETGLVSNQDCYDEDVNVYLAHLLHSFISPEYVEQSRKFLSKYDTDVFRRLATSTDARLKYQIYKTNADFLLVSIGIFDNPVTTGAARARLQPSEEAYIGRGKTYYHFAYTYSQQMHRKNAGVSEVLEKLSTGFEKYLRILSHMRGEYLDLHEALLERRGLPPRALDRRALAAGTAAREAGRAARALQRVAREAGAARPRKISSAWSARSAS